jgi:hypothetical protein
MKLSDLAHFYDETIRALRSDDDLAGLVAGSEVLLTPSVEHNEVIVRQGEIVIGCDLSDRDFWLTAAGQFLWLIQSVKGKGILLKSIRILPVDNGNGIDLNIAVDEKIRDQIAKQAGFSNPSIEDIAEWLSDEFINGDGGSDRAFQASYRDSEVADNGLILIGRNFSLVLEATADSTLWIRRLSPKPRNNDFSLAVLTGSVQFVDATVAAKLSSPEEVEKLHRLRHDQNSYIALWEKYDEISNRMVLNEAKQLGYVRYIKHDNAETVIGVEWRFFFKEDQFSTVEKFYKTVSKKRGSKLEIHSELPTWLNNEESQSGTDDRRVGKPLKATAIEMDRRYLVLDLEQGVTPEKEGYIYISIAGTEVNSQRRVAARDKINKLQNGMPQLCHLIEGLPVDAPRYRPFGSKDLGSAAKECFKGEPTEKQIDALLIALNTPDIALILGPPGTGKTQIIAAIQRCLAKAAKTEVGRDVLVSSFQHDAVDHVVSRSEVFGLPAIRVGKDNRASSILQNWIDKQQQKLINIVASQEKGSPCYSLIKSLRTDVAIFINGGLTDQEFEQRINNLISTIELLSEQHQISTSSSLKAKLKSALSTVNESAASLPDNKGHPAIRHARSLRPTLTSFRDDGPDRSYDCLLALSRSGTDISTPDKALLKKLSDSINDPDQNDLYDLADLRMRLIEKILPDFRPRKVRTSLNQTLENTLKEISAEVSGQLTTSTAGIVDILNDYSQVLSFQKDRVSKTLEDYTSTLGATCQGAVSKDMLSIFGGDDISFDTVIIDEAARANPLDLFIPMSLARRRIVLVGDHFQLAQMLDPEVEAEMLESGSLSEDDQKALGDSLFERLYEQLKAREADDGIRRTVMLDTQFRMHPDIGNFVSEQFYEARGEKPVKPGLLAKNFSINMPEYSDSSTHWIDVPNSMGGEKRRGTSWARHIEAEKVAAIAAEIVDSNNSISVGVITFYASQREVIFSELANKGICRRTEDGWGYETDYRTNSSGEERIRVGSVDAFQGKEFDVVILSMTRSNLFTGIKEEQLNQKYGFLRKRERLNVAFSRAKNLLIAIGDRAMFCSVEAQESLPSVYKYATSLCGDSK